MFSPELNNLIEASLTDGVITEQERAVIKKRALLEGVDPDEVDIYLDSRLQQMQIDAQGAVAKVRKCPACGAIITYMQTSCPQCGTEISNVGAAKSVQKLSDMINDATATEFNKEKRFERIKNIIKSFPVPTTKEDIMEFLFMAAPNAKKNNSLFGILGGAGMGALIGFVLLFVIGLLLELPSGKGIGNAIGNAFGYGIISAGIGALVGKKSLKKRVEPVREQNKMAAVWKTKCEQVIAKAKFTLRDDKNAMDTIHDIEKDLKLTK
ncbi:MAG: hypothetical protein IKW83_09145 [Muribaculaceae bacterium]|nr:hypothetical protein [Muribaculaceae bacterium]